MLNSLKMSNLRYNNSPTRCTTTYAGPNQTNKLTIEMATTNVESPVELWKDVPGMDGRYEVSTFGNVRTHNFANQGITRELSQLKDSHGYPSVWLRNNGKRKFTKVHRLVAMTFLKPVLGKDCVNHIDAIKTNNHLENLEWVTLGENNIHASKMGLQRGTFGKGEDNSNATLTAAQVIEMRQQFKRGKHKIKDFAKLYGTSEHHMGRIIRGRCWKNLPL